MGTNRGFHSKPGNNKILWAGATIVVILVLIMGATLIRIQSQPPEPLLVVLPTTEAPHAVAGTAPEAASSAASLPPVPTTADQAPEINKPRRVHPRTSEPAVAHTPR